MPKIQDPHGRFHQAIEDTKRYMIRCALSLHPGDLGAAAAWLNIGRRTLYTYIEELGMREEAGLERGVTGGKKIHQSDR